MKITIMKRLSIMLMILFSALQINAKEYLNQSGKVEITLSATTEPEYKVVFIGDDFVEVERGTLKVEVDGKEPVSLESKTIINKAGEYIFKYKVGAETKTVNIKVNYKGSISPNPDPVTEVNNLTKDNLVSIVNRSKLKTISWKVNNTSIELTEDFSTYENLLDLIIKKVVTPQDKKYNIEVSFDDGADLEKSKSSAKFVLEDKLYFTVTFKDGETTIVSNPVKSGEKVTKPDDPTKEGVEFKEWQLLNGNEYKFDNNGKSEDPIQNEDITLKAVWKTKKYPVRFLSKDGTKIHKINVDHGKKATQPATLPTKTGYFLSHWELNGSTYDLESPVTGPLDLIAVFVETANSFTVTFDADGGGPTPGTQTVQRNQKASEPKKPQKAGYRFLFWIAAGENIQFLFEGRGILGNTALKAKWERLSNTTTSHIVTFDSDGGSKIDKQEINVGEKSVKPTTNPQKTGFVFKEWQLDGKKYDFNTEVNKDITLKAVWTLSEGSVLITFNVAGGSKVDNQAISKGAQAKKPADPTKKGFKFLKWQLNGADFDFTTQIETNIELKALYKETKKDADDKKPKDKEKSDTLVPIGSNGGGVVQIEGEFAVGKKVTIKAIPNEGWEFVAWGHNHIIVSEDPIYTLTVEPNKKLLAHFSKITGTSAEWIDGEVMIYADRKQLVVKREGRYQLSLFNIAGQLLLNKSCDGEMTLPIALTSGTYIVRLVDGESTISEKVVIR